MSNFERINYENFLARATRTINDILKRNILNLRIVGWSNGEWQSNVARKVYSMATMVATVPPKTALLTRVKEHSRARTHEQHEFNDSTPHHLNICQYVQHKVFLSIECRDFSFRFIPVFAFFIHTFCFRCHAVADATDGAQLYTLFFNNGTPTTMYS